MPARGQNAKAHVRPAMNAWIHWFAMAAPAVRRPAVARRMKIVPPQNPIATWPAAFVSEVIVAIATSIAWENRDVLAPLANVI
jgi:hypothetical protein